MTLRRTRRCLRLRRLLSRIFRRGTMIIFNSRVSIQICFPMTRETSSRPHLRHQSPPRHPRHRHQPQPQHRSPPMWRRIPLLMIRSSLIFTFSSCRHRSSSSSTSLIQQVPSVDFVLSSMSTLFFLSLYLRKQKETIVNLGVYI